MRVSRTFKFYDCPGYLQKCGVRGANITGGGWDYVK
nr:MAG TPA: hypothetical protein [Caudoviricetes sp.]